MVTGQGYGLGIDGCKRLCPAAMGHSLVTLLSLSMSVKNQPLHKTLGKSQTYYPEHILGYGAWKTCYSLVMCFGSFRTDYHGGFWVRRSLHLTESGT